MKSAGKARSNGLYRHIRTSKEIIRNLLNDYYNSRKYIFFVKILTVDLCNNEVAEQWKDLGEKGHIYMDSDGYLKL